MSGGLGCGGWGGGVGGWGGILLPNFVAPGQLDFLPTVTQDHNFFFSFFLVLLSGFFSLGFFVFPRESSVIDKSMLSAGRVRVKQLPDITF